MRTLPASTLLDAISKLRPDESPVEQLRLAFLYALHHDPADVSDHQEVDAQLDQLMLQLTAVTDQHAAVSADLDELAREELCEFSPNHIWTLVRALRVQNQILNYYLGQAEAAKGTP